jgi:phospholipase C
LSRRQFLGGAAALGLAAAFPAVRLGQAAETPLRHLVLLMRENRSFDHYFGHFPGADGLPASGPVTLSAVACDSDPPHNRAAIESLLSGGDYKSAAALTAFTERQIPSAWSLARRFTLCDRYFASVPGPTFPNRLFSITGSTGGMRDNPHRIDPAVLPRPNMVDRLDAAGVEWACYLARVPDAGAYNPVAYYPERVNDPRANRSFNDFLNDAAAGRLPAVSWVIPEDPLTEHPPTPPQWGQRFADLAVHAVASGPRWRQSAVILNYDESGGFYDHVMPPAGYGFRVPCTVVSPYAKRGHVSHHIYDHASVLALVERTFAVAPLGPRDAAADPLTDCFDFSHPTSGPVTFPPLEQVTGCGVPPQWAAELLAMHLPQPAPSQAPDQPWPPEVAIGLGGATAVAVGGAAVALWRRSRRVA